MTINCFPLQIEIPVVMLCLMLCAIALPGAVQPSPYLQQGPLSPSSVAISSDAAWLASGDLDGVRLYDLRAGREVRLLKHYSVTSVAFAPDRDLLATAGTDQDARLPGANG